MKCPALLAALVDRDSRALPVCPSRLTGRRDRRDQDSLASRVRRIFPAVQRHLLGLDHPVGRAAPVGRDIRPCRSCRAIQQVQDNPPDQ